MTAAIRCGVWTHCTKLGERRYTILLSSAYDGARRRHSVGFFATTLMLAGRLSISPLRAEGSICLVRR